MENDGCMVSQSIGVNDEKKNNFMRLLVIVELLSYHSFRLLLPCWEGSKSGWCKGISEYQILYDV